MYLQPLPRELAGAGDLVATATVVEVGRVTCATALVSSAAPAIRWPNAFIAAVVEETQVLERARESRVSGTTMGMSRKHENKRFFGAVSEGLVMMGG